MERINSVSEYIETKPNWADALFLLREVMVCASLEECMKWSAPAYKHNGENIIGLAAYNEYVGIWFHQGVFLKDEANVLYNANESKTKGLRQWRFSTVKEIEENLALIDKYVKESIDNQKSGKKIKVVRGKVLVIPIELKEALEKDKLFNSAFLELTKSKQVEYADYISEAKQSKTKMTRLEKIIPMVIRQEGLHDKYRSN